MEVLMTRSRRRFSRPMIVLLVGLLAIGTLFVIHKTNRTTASINAAPLYDAPAIPISQPPAPVPAAPQSPGAMIPAPIITQTPTTPTTDPAPQIAQPIQSAPPQPQGDDHWANLLDHGTPGAPPPLVT